jgi:ADP-heptose:LPS heptosyltransferase
VKARRPVIPIDTLQTADKVLGLAACALAQPFRLARWLARDRRPAAGILLIKFWGIGSLQLLTPAAACLRRRHPGARLVLLTLAENGDFARGLGAFDDVRTLDVRSSSWLALLGRILRLLSGLRRARFDRVYDFEFFTRFSALVSLATGAAELSGFRSPSVWRGGFHDRTLPFNRYWHVARNFRALAGGEDGREVGPGDLVPYRVRPEETARVRALLSEAGLQEGAPYAVLNPNAGRLSLERRWPPASFAGLVRRLVEGEGLAVVLIGAPGEREHTAGVARAAGPLPAGRLVDLSGRLAQGELCALLAGARAVVSNDSGPMHLAAALGAPTVGLFGPETPVMYAPLGRRVEVLYEPPVCSPCINVHDNKVATCIHGRPECLVNITVEAALAATRAVLAGEPAEARAGWRVLRGGSPAPEEGTLERAGG